MGCGLSFTREEVENHQGRKLRGHEAAALPSDCIPTGSAPLTVVPGLRSPGRWVGAESHPEASFMVASLLEVGGRSQDVGWAVSWAATSSTSRGCYH